MKETSLVLFTLSAQTTVGAYCTLAAMHAVSGQSSAFNGYRFSAPTLLVLCLLMAMGLAAAFFHLGMPLRGYRGLANLRSSWLSRELLAFSLFGLLVVLHTGWVLFFPASTPPTALVALAAFSGIGLVYVMSQAYRLRTVPNWNHRATPLSFFAASFILGSLLALALLSLQKGVLPAQTAWGISLFTLCVGIDALAGWQRYQEKPHPRRFGAIHQPEQPEIKLIRLHLGLLSLALVFGGLAAWLSSPALLAPAFLLAVISQGASRVLFYQGGLGDRH